MADNGEEEYNIINGEIPSNINSEKPIQSYYKHKNKVQITVKE